MSQDPNDPYQQPGWQQPPGYQQPGYQQPGWQQPGYQQPGYQQPGYQQPGWQQQPAYGQYPGYPPPPQHRGTNGMAIGALVTAIAGFFVCAGLISPIAIILGNKALDEIKTTGEDGEGMARAGIVIGWIALGLLALSLVAIVVVIIAVAAA